MKKLFLILLLCFFGCNQKSYKYSVECPSITFSKVSDNTLYLTDTIDINGDTISYKNSNGTKVIMGRLQDCYIDTLN